MVNKRKGLIAVLVIGCLMTLIGTAMSSALELGIVNGFGIILTLLSKNALRIQENHKFIDTKYSQTKWLQLKESTGKIFCAIGIMLTIIATVIIGSVVNIAAICGICIFSLGTGKVAKTISLNSFNEFVVKVMKLFDFPSELITRAKSMEGMRGSSFG